MIVDLMEGSSLKKDYHFTQQGYGLLGSMIFLSMLGVSVYAYLNSSMFHAKQTRRLEEISSGLDIKTVLEESLRDLFENRLLPNCLARSSFEGLNFGGISKLNTIQNIQIDSNAPTAFTEAAQRCSRFIYPVNNNNANENIFHFCLRFDPNTSTKNKHYLNQFAGFKYSFFEITAIIQDSHSGDKKSCRDLYNSFAYSTALKVSYSLFSIKKKGPLQPAKIKDRISLQDEQQQDPKTIAKYVRENGRFRIHQGPKLN